MIENPKSVRTFDEDCNIFLYDILLTFICLMRKAALLAFSSAVLILMQNMTVGERDEDRFDMPM